MEVVFQWIEGNHSPPIQGEDLLIQRFKDMIYATIYGGILIAVVQGILGGLSFWVLGLPSPILWEQRWPCFPSYPSVEPL